MFDPDHSDDKVFVIGVLVPPGGCKPTVELIQRGRIIAYAITQRIDQAGCGNCSVRVGSRLIEAHNSEHQGVGTCIELIQTVYLA
jgi:hypothetical protein